MHVLNGARGLDDLRAVVTERTGRGEGDDRSQAFPTVQNGVPDGLVYPLGILALIGKMPLEFLLDLPTFLLENSGDVQDHSLLDVRVAGASRNL